MKDSGLSRTASATSLALADIDGDGDLDLYCTHYIDVMHLLDPTTRFAIMKRDGRWTVLKVNDEPTTLPKWKDRFEALPDGRVREFPEVHGLYRNDGHGHFTPIQFEPGVFLNEEGKPIPPYRDWGLAVERIGAVPLFRSGSVEKEKGVRPLFARAFGAAADAGNERTSVA